MPKNKVSEWSTTAASNTDIGGININEGCPPSGINNAIRELMAQVRDFQLGADGDGLTVSTLNATTATIGALNATSATLTSATLTNPTINGFTGNTAVVNIGSGQIYKDVSGNVGIGTSTPTNGRLEVNGNAYATNFVLPNDASLFWGAGDGSSYVRGNSSTDYVAIGTTGSEHLRIAASGAFGLSGANYGTSGQVLTSAGSGSAPTWGSPASLSTASGSAPSYSARAWVNFNGTGTVAIRASGNVSSITDNGVGEYTVNFTTAMPDANYAVIACNVQYDNGNNTVATQVKGTFSGGASNQTTSSVRIQCATSGPVYDLAGIYVSIFR